MTNEECLDQVRLHLQHREFEVAKSLLDQLQTELGENTLLLEKFSPQIQTFQKEAELGLTALKYYNEAMDLFREGKKKEALKALERVPKESFLFPLATQLRTRIQQSR